MNPIVNSIITLYSNEMHCNSPWLSLYIRQNCLIFLGKHLLKMQYFASNVCRCLTMCIRNLNECQCPRPSCKCFFTLPNSMNYGFQSSYLTWGAIAIVPSPTLAHHVFTTNVLCHIAQINSKSFFTQVCSHTSFHLF